MTSREVVCPAVGVPANLEDQVDENELDRLQELICAGIFGFSLAIGNALFLLLRNVSYCLGGNPFVLDALLGLDALIVAFLLFVLKLKADWLQQGSGIKAAFFLYASCTVISVACSLLSIFALGAVTAALSLVLISVIYAPFLSTLTRKLLALVINISFLLAGVMLAFISIDSMICSVAYTLTALISLVFTTTFELHTKPSDLVIGAEESKEHSIKVKGNNTTLFLVGFMLAIIAEVFMVASDAVSAILTISLAVLASGLICMIMGSAPEKAFKNFMLKTMSCISCILLLLPALPEVGKLIVLGIYLTFVCANVNIIFNAIIETARFNIISPLWLLCNEGLMMVLGIVTGFVLLVGASFLVSVYAADFSFVVYALFIFTCCCFQIRVNYQVYPFEPIIDMPAEAEASVEVERVGKKKALWQMKVDAACKMYRLSPREIEVLQLLLKGRDAKYIMDKFVVSQSTAKTHIYNIYRKFDIHSRQELLDFIEDIEVSDSSEN